MSLAPDKETTDGFIQAILAELATRLAELASTGIEAQIDLRSLPMDPPKRTALDAKLGKGDVTATIADRAGRTEVFETRYAGVWRLAHYDMHDTLLMEEIAIAPVPDILRADPTDMAEAAARLGAELALDTKKGHAND